MSLAKWIPDRKVLAGGISGVLAFFAATLFGGLDAETSAAIAGGVLMAVEYFVPPSVADVLNKIDATIKKAGIDPKTHIGNVAGNQAEK